MAFFFKQFGRHVADSGGGDGTFSDLWPDEIERTFFEGDDTYSVYLKDRAGADPSEWPDDLKIQEFPKVAYGE